MEFTDAKHITRATIAGLAALSLMGSLVATSEPAAAGSFMAADGMAAVGTAAVGTAAAGMAAAGTGAAGAAVGPARLSLADWRLARCWRRPMRMDGYGYGYGGYGRCTSYAPIYDAYGNYLGQQPVNGC